jgi:hypothetical protein
LTVLPVVGARVTQFQRAAQIAHARIGTIPAADVSSKLPTEEYLNVDAARDHAASITSTLIAVELYPDGVRVFVI